MSQFDRTIAEVASRQHGAFSARQARVAGGSRQMLERRVRAGRIEKLDAGVYRIAGLPRAWEARMMAVILGAGPGAVVSHRAAAALWGLEGFAERS